MSYTSLTAALLGAALFAPVVQAQTSYPLTIENCGVQVTFDAAPETAVTVGQAGTEVLYALGLGDKVAGTSVWFTDVLPEYAALNADIERLADNDPSFESVVDKRPDIVVAQYEWHIGPQGIVATREQFTDLGIPTYVLPADCWAKDNSTGSDGTRLAMFEMDSIYAGVTSLRRSSMCLKKVRRWWRT